MAENFTLKYLEFAKKHIPCKTVVIRPNDKPWFNSDIRKQIRTRDRLHKQIKRNSSCSLLQRYKAQRNKVNNMIHYAREQFFINANDLLDKEKQANPKSYWSLIKKLQGNTQSYNIPPLQDDISGNILINDEDKANLLNKFFCSISNLENSEATPPDFERRTDKNLDVPFITIEEIKDVLEVLPLGKANGHDRISHNMLKNTSSTICKPLQIIFNNSLQSGKFPKIWKSALVIALFKKGVKSDPTNYRPISLLSCVGKVFERIVFKHIYNFLLKNLLIYKYQSGFTTGHCITHQLIKITKTFV